MGKRLHNRWCNSKACLIPSKPEFPSFYSNNPGGYECEASRGPRRKWGLAVSSHLSFLESAFIFSILKGEGCGEMGRAKDNTEKGIHWPQSFYSWFQSDVFFLILPRLWAKLTSIRENSDSAPPCTDSSTLKWYHSVQRTKVPKWLQISAISCLYTEGDDTVQIHSDIKVCLSQQSFRSRKWHAWKEKFILEMHLRASEKIKGTQYLTLLLPLYKRKASAIKAQIILITLFVHITFNSTTFVRTESPYSTILWGSSENYTVSQEHST